MATIQFFSGVPYEVAPPVTYTTTPTATGPNIVATGVRLVSTPYANAEYQVISLGSTSAGWVVFSDDPTGTFVTNAQGQFNGYVATTSTVPAQVMDSGWSAAPPTGQLYLFGQAGAGLVWVTLRWRRPLVALARLLAHQKAQAATRSILQEEYDEACNNTSTSSQPERVMPLPWTTPPHPQIPARSRSLPAEVEAAANLAGEMRNPQHGSVLTGPARRPLRTRMARRPVRNG